MTISLADIKRSISHKVRLLNPFPESQEISSNGITGAAKEIESKESVISLA